MLLWFLLSLIESLKRSESREPTHIVRDSPVAHWRVETKRVRKVSVRMSAGASGGKSNRYKIRTNTERGSAPVGNSSPGREREGGLQDTRRIKCVTRASTECIQTAKNVHTRRRTLVKSKEEWASTPENQDKICFTSFFSLRFPSTRSDSQRGKVRVATKLRNNDLRRDSDTKVAAVQPEFKKDFLVNTLRASTGTTTEDKDVSKSQNGDLVYSWPNHAEHALSSHGSSDGIQRGLALCAENCTQEQSAGCEQVAEHRVTESKSVKGQSGVNYPLEQNAEGTVSHSNLIPFREDTSSKVDSDCQVCACSPKAIHRNLSLPSFPDSRYDQNPKSDLVNSNAVMFTSTLVSVLAPHWTGRLRRHKRGFSDVGQDTEQNTNLSASAQNEQQQRFPLQQIQGWGEPVSDCSNRLSGSTGFSGSSVEWQNESFSHLSETKKQFSKTSYLRMNRHAVDQTAESGNSLHTSMDSSEVVPRSSMSLQFSNYRRKAQSMDQGVSFPSLRSRPTTSTLLLSSRRLNSRKPTHESLQMEKQLSTSISSLNTPCRSILRISQPQHNLVFPNDPSKETHLTKNRLASPEQLSVTHKLEPSSSKPGEMDSSSKHRYIITGDFDMINRSPPATNDASRERLFSNYTRLHQSDTLKSAQGQRGFDPNFTDNKHLSNSNISEKSAWISQKENANSRFGFSQIPSNLNSERLISNTSMTNTNLTPSTYVQSSSINNMINSNKTSTINSPTSPRTIQSITTSGSFSLTPVPLTPNQHNIQNSCGSDALSSSPVNSVRMRTFTESLSISPRKDSTVEGTSQSQYWPVYLNAKKQSDESNQSTLDQPSPLSPSEFKPRKVCTPSIYKYLRETSPPKSTQTSPALSSPNPQISPLKQMQEEDQNSRNLCFTFDLSTAESHDPLSKPDSSSPQSVPDDSGRRSGPRLSKSPYSTLISTRAAVNILSSPPVTHQHSRSLSYSSSPVDDKSPEIGKKSYTSVLRDRLSQRKSLVMEPVGSIDLQVISKTVSFCQDGISKSSTDAKFSDCQTNTLIPDTTHPKQTDSVIKNIPHEGLNSIFLSQSDKRSTCTNDRLNSKELSSPQVTSLVGEVPQKEEEPEILQRNGTFEASQGPNLKRSLFALRSKKDNVLTSSAEGLAVKKGEMTGPKTIKKVDQFLNHLRQRFGGKISDDSDTTNKRKTKKEDLKVKSCESVMKENQSNDLTFTRESKPEELLDSKAFERTRKLDQTDSHAIRAQNKSEEFLNNKALETSRQLDLMVDLAVKRQTKSAEPLDSKAFDRTRNLDNLDDGTVRTQNKSEEILDIRGLEKSGKLDQSDDVTVRRKTKNEWFIDSMTSETKRKEQRLSESLSPKTPQTSPRSPNTQVSYIIDLCDSSTPTLSFSHKKTNNSPNLDDHKRLIEESKNRHLGRPLSPNWPKPDNISRYATLPPGKRSRLVTSPTPSPFECFSEDEQNDNVFFSSVLPKRNHSSHGENENVDQPDNSLKTGTQNSTGGILSSPIREVDIKYGLHRGRSVSVSSVVSGRPSGPGRISTGSRQSSVSDLSSLDSFVSKSQHSSINSSLSSPENDFTTSTGHMPYKGPTGRGPSEGRLRSPDNQEASSFSWDMESDPTPPHSPLQTRRISQISSPSSATCRSPPESLSPRGLLPSRNYKSTLSVFEESDSETTTDGEYYLNSDDDNEKETEL
ncbi:hypothetical protein C0J50_22726 [Silurus asotus]|uniref:Exophilin 5 n=1 Tax=Silurus asotus TaxID=30991 RepID=A0AAD5ALJ7_SILAS|nr:hypothetical protein C0J50_22726 [Silurus asotus]